MKQITNNSTQLLTPSVGGRGAKKYIKPRIEIIFLDNEISLALASAPPAGPGEVNLNLNQQRIDPFHTNLG